MDKERASRVDEVLRYMRIADEEELDAAEHDFAGTIKLGPAGRYGCRLLVRGELFEFKLGQLPGGEEDFLVTKNGLPFEPKREGYDSLLYRLVRHRTAEYIGGIRAGHHEYNIRQSARRLKTSV